MSFIEELKRRNVVKTAVLYLIASWLILQVADVLFEALELPSAWVRLILALIVLGFPMVLIFSWVFEMTPEGLRREKDIDRSQSITAQTGQKINFLIIALLILAIGGMALDRLIPESGGDDTTPVAAEAGQLAGAADGQSNAGDDVTVPELSIAVLPFVDMSPEQDQEYFTDGVSEEVLNLLARVQDFRVAGRTSSFAFKGKNEDLRVIGQKLGVSVLLEGSVRKAGDQIRVTAQLIKVDDGYHLWSATYDRKLENIFALQDDIASQVVAALKTTLLTDSAHRKVGDAITRERPTANSEAYANYLRGRYQLRKRTYDGMFDAIDEFGAATDLDPDFAEAYAGLANAYLLIVDYGYGSEDQYYPLASAAIDRALALDADLSEGWTAKGVLMNSWSFDPSRIEELMPVFERAVALNPNNADALMELSYLYFRQNREQEAEQMMRRAYDVDPLAPNIVGSMAMFLKERGEDARSAEMIRELEALDPDAGYLYRTKYRIALADGDNLAAIKWLHRAVQANARDIPSRTELARALLKTGAVEAAEHYAREAYELAPSSPLAMVRLADMMQYLGEYDAALTMLDDELAKYPNTVLLQSYRATVLYHAGRYADAMAQVEAIAPGLGQDPPVFSNPNAMFWSPRIAWIHRRNGDQARALQLYDVFREVWASFPLSQVGSTGDQAIYLARWHAATGDYEALLGDLELMLDVSPGGAWDYFHDPMIASYAGQPGFDAIASQFEAIRVRNREALAAEGVL